MAKPDPARRNERAHRAILDAAIALVAERGYENVSIEAIAHRAGVGKQTIYRWWPSKGAVVLEALDSGLATVVDFPDSGDIVADLRAQLLGVTRLLGGTEVGAVYQGLIAAAQSDHTLSQAHLDQVIRPATEAAHRRLALARDRGELRSGVDDQAIIDMLYGAVYYRLLLHTRAIEPEQVDALLAIAFEGLRPRPG